MFFPISLLCGDSTGPLLGGVGYYCQRSDFCLIHISFFLIFFSFSSLPTQVSKIVSNVPHLEFLNLSSNPLSLSVLERSCAGSFAGVRKLVLNNSKASWETVHTILQELPE